MTRPSPFCVDVLDACTGAGLEGHSWLGRTLDSYRLDEFLGEGQFSAVFRVTTPTGGTRAMKIFKTDLARRPSEQGALLSEVVAGMKCCSEYVVRYDRLGVIPVRPGHHRSLPVAICYAIQEFVEGDAPSYDRLLRCPEEERLATFFCLAQGLRDIHKAGLVHRDLKAGNARCRGGIAKWLDLGQVHIPGGESGGRRSAPSPNGRPIQVPPEAWSEGRVCYDRWRMPGDVFSFGVTLFHLLTGAAPWDQADASRLSAEWNECLDASEAPKFLKDLIHQMMAQRPADRPDMHAVVERMRPHAAAATR